MKTIDMANLLAMFDESMSKIIEHLETGYPDRALIRAKETQRVFRKYIYSDEEIAKKL
jgi:hypothetical protein